MAQPRVLPWMRPKETVPEHPAWAQLRKHPCTPEATLAALTALFRDRQALKDFSMEHVHSLQRSLQEAVPWTAADPRPALALHLLSRCAAMVLPGALLHPPAPSPALHAALNDSMQVMVGQVLHLGSSCPPNTAAAALLFMGSAHAGCPPDLQATVLRTACLLLSPPPLADDLRSSLTLPSPEGLPLLQHQLHQCHHARQQQWQQQQQRQQQTHNYDHDCGHSWDVGAGQALMSSPEHAEDALTGAGLLLERLSQVDTPAALQLLTCMLAATAQPACHPACQQSWQLQGQQPCKQSWQPPPLSGALHWDQQRQGQQQQQQQQHRQLLQQQSHHPPHGAQLQQCRAVQAAQASLNAGLLLSKQLRRLADSLTQQALAAAQASSSSSSSSSRGMQPGHPPASGTEYQGQPAGVLPSTTACRLQFLSAITQVLQQAASGASTSVTPHQPQSHLVTLMHIESHSGHGASSYAACRLLVAAGLLQGCVEAGLPLPPLSHTPTPLQPAPPPQPQQQQQQQQQQLLASSPPSPQHQAVVTSGPPLPYEGVNLNSALAALATLTTSLAHSVQLGLAGACAAWGGGSIGPPLAAWPGCDTWPGHTSGTPSSRGGGRVAPGQLVWGWAAGLVYAQVTAASGPPAPPRAQPSPSQGHSGGVIPDPGRSEEAGEVGSCSVASGGAGVGSDTVFGARVGGGMETGAGGWPAWLPLVLPCDPAARQLPGLAAAALLHGCLGLEGLAACVMSPAPAAAAAAAAAGPTASAALREPPAAACSYSSTSPMTAGSAAPQESASSAAAREAAGVVNSWLQGRLQVEGLAAEVPLLARCLVNELLHASKTAAWQGAGTRAEPGAGAGVGAGAGERAGAGAGFSSPALHQPWHWWTALRARRGRWSLATLNLPPALTSNGLQRVEQQQNQQQQQSQQQQQQQGNQELYGLPASEQAAAAAQQVVWLLQVMRAAAHQAAAMYSATLAAGPPGWLQHLDAVRLRDLLDRLFVAVASPLALACPVLMRMQQPTKPSRLTQPTSDTPRHGATQQEQAARGEPGQWLPCMTWAAKSIALALDCLATLQFCRLRLPLFDQLVQQLVQAALASPVAADSLLDVAIPSRRDLLVDQEASLAVSPPGDSTGGAGLSAGPVRAGPTGAAWDPVQTARLAFLLPSMAAAVGRCSHSLEAGKKVLSALLDLLRPPATPELLSTVHAAFGAVVQSLLNGPAMRQAKHPAKQDTEYLPSPTSPSPPTLLLVARVLPTYLQHSLQPPLSLPGLLAFEQGLDQVLAALPAGAQPALHALLTVLEAGRSCLTHCGAATTVATGGSMQHLASPSAGSGPGWASHSMCVGAGQQGGEGEGLIPGQPLDFEALAQWVKANAALGSSAGLGVGGGAGRPEAANMASSPTAGHLEQSGQGQEGAQGREAGLVPTKLLSLCCSLVLRADWQLLPYVLHSLEVLLWEAAHAQPSSATAGGSRQTSSASASSAGASAVSAGASAFTPHSPGIQRWLSRSVAGRRGLGAAGASIQSKENAVALLQHLHDLILGSDDYARKTLLLAWLQAQMGSPMRGPVTLRVPEPVTLDSNSGDKPANGQLASLKGARRLASVAGMLCAGRAPGSVRPQPQKRDAQPSGFQDVPVLFAM